VRFVQPLLLATCFSDTVLTKSTQPELFENIESLPCLLINLQLLPVVLFSFGKLLFEPGELPAAIVLTGNEPMQLGSSPSAFGRGADRLAQFGKTLLHGRDFDAQTRQLSGQDLQAHAFLMFAASMQTQQRVERETKCHGSLR